MKHDFLNAMLQTGKPVEKAEPALRPDNQCNSCSGGNVVAKSGVESGEDISKLKTNTGDANNAMTVNDKDGKTTIIGRGPLGEVFTQALNEQYKRVSIQTDLEIGIEGLDGIDSNRINANGQVLPPQTPESLMATRTRLATGILPPIDDQANPTCLNALIQAINRVRNVEFVFVHDPALGKTPSQQELDPTSVKTIPFDSGAQPSVTAAVESVQIVIKLK